MHMDRHLAAILAADVVGYSRLMERDEAATLSALRAHRKDLIDPTIASHNGRIVKLIGDGTLVEFASVVDAVTCAVAIQQGMAKRNARMPIDHWLELRIGVHLGDAIVEDEDIYGDGVNLAARLEGLAEPGGICLSQQALDQIETKLNLAYEDLGQQKVKNIARPVRVYRVKAPQTQPRYRNETPSHQIMERLAVAVLPFNNIGGNRGQQYFADGLTEDLINALAHWRSFPVIARNSCFAYKSKAVDITQAARELGARYVLEGSVRRSGARVRITVQLIDGANGHHLWAERYDRKLEDIFEVQDDIAQRITAVVAPELDKAELLRSTDKRQEDLDAWDLCLRAKLLLREKTHDGNAQARDLLIRAISARPDYADAHAGLAQSFNQDILIAATDDRTAVATRAMEAAKNAIKCDEASSWAHHELGTAYQWLNRLDDALDEARIAVELNPNDAYALHALGNKSDLAGDPNGIAYMEKAQKLNPEDAQRHTHLAFLARAYLAIGDYGAAIDRVRQAIRRRSDYAAAHYVLGIALSHLGRLEEARASLNKCDELSRGFVASRRNWRPYTDEAKNEMLRVGLRDSGD